MNTIAFIRDARTLIGKIKDTSALPESDRKEYLRKQHQQDIDYLFNNMTNPSVPTAHKLLNVAVRQKYTVDSKVYHSISRF